LHLEVCYDSNLAFKVSEIDLILDIEIGLVLIVTPNIDILAVLASCQNEIVAGFKPIALKVFEGVHYLLS
jgi:hypothetical protein